MSPPAVEITEAVFQSPSSLWLFPIKLFLINLWRQFKAFHRESKFKFLLFCYHNISSSTLASKKWWSGSKKLFTDRLPDLLHERTKYAYRLKRNFKCIYALMTWRRGAVNYGWGTRCYLWSRRIESAIPFSDRVTMTPEIKCIEISNRIFVTNAV